MKIFASIKNTILKIPYKHCERLLVILFTLITIFHILVISEIIPYAYVWAGKLQTKDEMYKFETVSLAVNIIMTIIVLNKMKIINIIKNKVVIKYLLLAMSLIFLLNTIGNTYSISGLELYLATPMTFFLSVLIYRLSLEE